MLDQLRRHSQSWVTLFLFGAVILVFVLFYGYNQMGPTLGRSTVASVNGAPITAGELAFSSDNQEAYYRQLFQDKIPEDFLTNVRQMALQQLITARLLEQYAAQVGLVISDEELAEKIRSLKGFADDKGQFDAAEYLQSLQGIQQKYRLSFEELLRSDLVGDRLSAFVKATTLVSDDEAATAQRREATRWTFEVVRIDPNQLVETKQVATTDEALAVADRLQSVFTQTVSRDAILKEHGLQLETVGPFALAERGQLFGAEAAATDVAAALSLTAPGMCPAPIAVGPKRVVCRLVTRTQPDAATVEKDRATYRTQYDERRQTTRETQWIASLKRSAKIDIAPGLFED